MKKISLKQGSIILIVVYIFMAFLFYFIAHDQLTYSNVTDNIRTSKNMSPLGEIVNGKTILQPFVSKTDILDGVNILTATYDRINSGELIVQIVDMETHAILAEKVIKLQSIPNNDIMPVLLDQPLHNVKGRQLGLMITSNGTLGNAVTIYQNDNSSLGQGLFLNGQQSGRTLCFSTTGRDFIWFGQYYFLLALITGVVLGAYLIYLIHAEKKGKKSLSLRIISAFIKYQYLLAQLVARDFKTKYKRSVFGVLWSFLNPLLMMMVQYIVFSTLFKSSIKNFPVYLLTGIVLFNFFMEAVSMSLMSIVGNANLITKVYMPKYIYPVSKVLSSTINLLLSMLPLFLVVIITKTPFTPAFLLLPFGIICTVVFCIGLGMLLSSAMVYFRDTQFLWSVVSMLWMYFTPIFYPESIIPSKYMLLYKMNPLYHFIRFNRIIIMQGVSPEPMAYLFCIIFSLGMLGIGAWVFKKTQNGFILHI